MSKQLKHSVMGEQNHPSPSETPENQDNLNEVEVLKGIAVNSLTRIYGDLCARLLRESSENLERWMVSKRKTALGLLEDKIYFAESYSEQRANSFNEKFAMYRGKIREASVVPWSVFVDDAVSEIRRDCIESIEIAKSEYEKRQSRLQDLFVSMKADHDAKIKEGTESKKQIAIRKIRSMNTTDEIIAYLAVCVAEQYPLDLYISSDDKCDDEAQMRHELKTFERIVREKMSKIWLEYGLKKAAKRNKSKDKRGVLAS